MKGKGRGGGYIGESGNQGRGWRGFGGWSRGLTMAVVKCSDYKIKFITCIAMLIGTVFISFGVWQEEGEVIIKQKI